MLTSAAAAVLLSWLKWALGVIVTFGTVIFIHELGHFLVCKWVKMRVEEFSFGFGRALFSFKRGDTLYALRLIPLGGYVKPAGENIEEFKGAQDEYFSKPWYQRLMVVLAGPTMNYLLAFVLFSGVMLAVGEPVPSEKAVIGELVAGHPAHAAGLKPGDTITSLDGMAVHTWTELSTYIHASPGKTIKVAYERAGGVKGELPIVARQDSASKFGVIGIRPETEFAPVSVLSAMGSGAYQCWHWTRLTLVTLASKIYHREDPELAGPVGIVQMVGQATHSGLDNFIYFIGLISVAIGIFNLFPIPILDGGHAVLYLWEGISRRRLTEKLIRATNSVGLALLGSIFLFATYSDIARIYKTRRAAREQAVQVSTTTVSGVQPAASTAPVTAVKPAPGAKKK